ncbi:MAG: FG-GAP-like repeat-containing protein [bacterium]
MQFHAVTKVYGVCLQVLLLAAAFPAHLEAQFRVTRMTPRQNEIDVAVTSTITVILSNDLDPSTLDETTWLVHGSQTGFYQGRISYGAATRTAEFVPVSPFREGEVVSVILTALIQSETGRTLQPFQGAFTVTVEYGTGIFDERIDIPLGQDADNPFERDPSAIYAGDFDNDTFPDLAVANKTTNTVAVLMNRFFEAGGTVRLESSIPVGNGPTSIAGADFDRDGFLDLAVSNFDENTISVLRNFNRGRLTVVQTIPTREHPVQLEARDYNNDGQMDLAVLVLGVNQLQIFLNLGDGSFGTASNTYDTGASPYGLASGDFDNDDDVDLVVTNSGDNSIIVYKNDGRANFANAGEIPVPDFPTAVRAGDLSGRSAGEYGDGVLDLVLVHPNFNEVSVFVNQTRDGGFVLQQRHDAGLHPTDALIADFDTTDNTALATGFGKDHDLDFAVPNLFSNDVYVWRNQFNNGFQLNEQDIYPAGETPVSITGADFDRDGDIDLALTNLMVHGISILLNQGGRGGGLQLTRPTAAFDFGQVYVGTDSTHSVRLYNPTEEPIVITEISTTLPQFTAVLSQTIIEPGRLFSFSLTFSPTDTVAYEDTLRVRSTIAGELEELEVALRGEGIIAIISVVPDTLDFGRVLPPQTATLPIEITNSGNGALNISSLEFTDPVFSAPVNSLSVPAHSSQQLDIAVSPAMSVAYLDTLLIHNNDSLNSPASVILLAGPNAFPPELTSADTVTAVEDVFFTYTATVSDSDGTQAQFVFANLPSWLHPSSADAANNQVEGTPREGDRDTSFTVIALDAVFSDTLQVTVQVLPVNDPPQFDPVTGFTTTELTFLSFDLSASDPEDSTLSFAAQGLPAGAVLTDNGDNTATFSWIPPAGSRGVVNVSVVASEVYEVAPLSATVVVRIEVVQALPDLVATSLSVPTTDIAQNQTLPVTGIVRADFAAVDTPFRLTFFHNQQVARDTVLTRLGYNDELAFTYRARFDRAGDHRIVFEVDIADQVIESDEENNAAMLLLKARKAQVVVRPNPFTPNNDGFNDRAVFDFTDLVLQEPELKIFDFGGQLLATLTGGFEPLLLWDGRDRRGREQKPGVYLYVLSDGRERVASGYLVLAR